MRIYFPCDIGSPDTCKTEKPFPQPYSTSIKVTYVVCGINLTSFCLYARRGFKALKQTVKLHYRLGNHSEMMTAYREMLTYIQ